MKKYTYENIKNFEKAYAIKLSKELSKKADEIGKELSRDIASKVEETWKTNIIESYEPRGMRRLYSY